jgi:hypothetical protein
MGSHDGSFDLMNTRQPASMTLERLAEDGLTGPLSADFAASGQGSADVSLMGLGPMGTIPPGTSTSMVFDLDPIISLEPLSELWSDDRSKQ